MVVGNGLVARQFASYQQQPDFLVFASGVSNSKTQRAEAYAREIQLLEEYLQQEGDRTFVYFSTCSVYDPQEQGSVYVQHKLKVEEIIQSRAKRYQIFRVSNLAGVSPNPNTLLNFFFNHIRNGVNFDLWTKACRNIIDTSDAYAVMDHILEKRLFANQIVNIANPSNFRVTDIVSSIEDFLGIRSNYVEIEKGACFDIDISVVNPLIQQLDISFDSSYLPRILAKYYPR